MLQKGGEKKNPLERKTMPIFSIKVNTIYIVTIAFYFFSLRKTRDRERAFEVNSPYPNPDTHLEVSYFLDLSLGLSNHYTLPPHIKRSVT